MKTSLIARLVALAASAAVTLSVVTVLADYGLPRDAGTQLLAQAAAQARQADPASVF